MVLYWVERSKVKVRLMVNSNKAFELYECQLVLLMLMRALLPHDAPAPDDDDDDDCGSVSTSG